MTEITAISVEIAKLAVKTGDVLVLKCDSHISIEHADRLRAAFEPVLPEGVKMMVLDGSMNLAVLTREEIDARSA